MRSSDPRPARTRAALIRAFNELVLNSAVEPIRVADIIRLADVSRSTFYEHYDDADALHREALAGPLSILGDALFGKASEARLVAILQHFFDHRQRANTTLNSSGFRDQVTGVLAELIAKRMGADDAGSPDPEAKLAAWQLAEATLGLVRVWIRGEVECGPDLIASAILRASAWRDGTTAENADSPVPRIPPTS
jgi:AcrR family transcriptional regulator